MLLRRMSFPVVLAAALGLAGAARADDCATVANAYEAMAKIDAYHETVTLPGQTMELIAIGDTLYMKQETSWRKMPLKAGGRMALMKKVVPDASALKDCSRIGAEAVDGIAATAYGYTPPQIKGAPAMGPQKVWIDDATGLPLRMTAEGGDIRIDYEGVKAPIP